MNNQELKSLIVSKLKNGFMIAPNNNKFNSYDDCIFIEGMDVNRLSEVIISLFVTEVTYKKESTELDLLRSLEKAARNDAIFWVESLCNRDESDRREKAIEDFENALKNLDKARDSK